MCKGAKYKVQIYKGSANFNGKRIGHMWNKYKGKIIDCSSYTSRDYKGRRILLMINFMGQIIIIMVKYHLKEI